MCKLIPYLLMIPNDLWKIYKILDLGSNILSEKEEKIDEQKWKCADGWRQVAECETHGMSISAFVFEILHSTLFFKRSCNFLYSCIKQIEQIFFAEQNK